MSHTAAPKSQSFASWNGAFRNYEHIWECNNAQRLTPAASCNFGLRGGSCWIWCLWVCEREKAARARRNKSPTTFIYKLGGTPCDLLSLSFHGIRTVTQSESRMPWKINAEWAGTHQREAQLAKCDKRSVARSQNIPKPHFCAQFSSTHNHIHTRAKSTREPEWHFTVCHLMKPRAPN